MLSDLELSSDSFEQTSTDEEEFENKKDEYSKKTNGLEDSLRSKRFRSSSSRKLGLRQISIFFCSRSNFRAITRLETLATQAYLNIEEMATAESGLKTPRINKNYFNDHQWVAKSNASFLSTWDLFLRPAASDHTKWSHRPTSGSTTR